MCGIIMMFVVLGVLLVGDFCQFGFGIYCYGIFLLGLGFMCLQCFIKLYEYEDYYLNGDRKRKIPEI